MELVARDVGVRLSGRIVLDGANLALSPGEVVGLLGPTTSPGSSAVVTGPSTLRPASSTATSASSTLITAPPA